MENSGVEQRGVGWGGAGHSDEDMSPLIHQQQTVKKAFRVLRSREPPTVCRVWMCDLMQKNRGGEIQGYFLAGGTQQKDFVSLSKQVKYKSASFVFF